MNNFCPNPSHTQGQDETGVERGTVFVGGPGTRLKD